MAMHVSALPNALGLSLVSDTNPISTSAPQELSRGRSRVRTLREEAGLIAGAKPAPLRTSASAMPFGGRHTGDVSLGSKASAMQRADTQGALQRPSVAKKKASESAWCEGSSLGIGGLMSRRPSGGSSPASDWPGYDSPLFDMSPLGAGSPSLSQEDLTRSLGFESSSASSTQTLLPYPPARPFTAVSIEDLDVAFYSLPFAVRVANRPSWHFGKRSLQAKTPFITVSCTAFQLELIHAPEPVRRNYMRILHHPRDETLNPREKFSVLLYVAHKFFENRDVRMDAHELGRAEGFVDQLWRAKHDAEAID